MVLCLHITSTVTSAKKNSLIYHMIFKVKVTNIKQQFGSINVLPKFEVVAKLDGSSEVIVST